MPKVSGRISDVLNNDVTDEICLIRSKRIEPTSDGIKTDYTRQVKIEGGYVNFECQPGAAILMLVDNQRRPTRTIPLLVPDSDVTLADAVAAMKIVEEENPRLIEKLVQDALTGQKEAKAAATQASESAAKAAASESAASDSASDALSYKEAAEESAEQSKTSADNAAESATTATNASSDAKENLEEIRTLKISIDDKAEQTRENSVSAGESAERAETAAQEAESYAGGEIPESRLSHELKIKIDSIDDKADKNHKHYISDIWHLQDKLDGKSFTGHNHEMGDIILLNDALDLLYYGKAAKEHRHDISEIDGIYGASSAKSYIGAQGDGWTNILIKNDDSGWVNIFSDPEEGNHPTRKSYVDNLNKRNTVCGYTSVRSPGNIVFGSPINNLEWNDKYGFPQWASRASNSSYQVDINEEGFYLVSVNFRSTGGSYGSGVRIGGVMKMRRDNQISLVSSTPKFFNGSGSAGGYVYVSSEGANFGLTMESYEGVTGYFDIAITKMI